MSQPPQPPEQEQPEQEQQEQQEQPEQLQLQQQPKRARLEQPQLEQHQYNHHQHQEHHQPRRALQLLDLPFELLLLVGVFVKESEAVPLLTVSSRFHDIFIHTVWRVLTRRAIDMPEPLRSSLFARYGRCIRCVYLLTRLDADFVPFDWGLYFPNVVEMAIDIHRGMSIEQKQDFLGLLGKLHGLKGMEVLLFDSSAPFDLDTVAAAIGQRMKDRHKARFRHFGLMFLDDECDQPFAVLARFTQALEQHGLPEIRLSVRNIKDDEYATPAQMRVLQPYLDEIPEPSIDPADVSHGGCYAAYNRRLFGSGSDVFPQLAEIDVHPCCRCADVNDYGDFGPRKFPVLRQLTLSDSHRCSQIDRHGPAVNTILAQHWPQLKSIVINYSVARDTLVELFELNPQLTAVEVNIEMWDQAIARLDLASFLRRLPALNSLSLYMRFGIGIYFGGAEAAAGSMPLSLSLPVSMKASMETSMSKVMVTSIAMQTSMPLPLQMPLQMPRPPLIHRSLERLSLEGFAFAPDALVVLLFGFPGLRALILRGVRLMRQRNDGGGDGDAVNADVDDNASDAVDAVVNIARMIRNARNASASACPIEEFSLATPSRAVTPGIVSELIGAMPQLKLFTFMDPSHAIPDAVCARFPDLTVNVVDDL